jgi:hypothetical protein
MRRASFAKGKKAGCEKYRLSPSEAVLSHAEIDTWVSRVERFLGELGAVCPWLQVCEALSVPVSVRVRKSILEAFLGRGNARSGHGGRRGVLLALDSTPGVDDLRARAPELSDEELIGILRAIGPEGVTARELSQRLSRSDIGARLKSLESQGVYRFLPLRSREHRYSCWPPDPPEPEKTTAVV